MEFDTVNMQMRLPGDKLADLSEQLKFFIRQNKVTLRELQSLIGSLNFACQVIAPGRAFCRRLIDATTRVSKPHHRIRVTKEMREDLKLWTVFLSEYNGVTVMLDYSWSSSDILQLFTDSAGGLHRGFGAYFQGHWAQSCWPIEWGELGILSDITFLELFPVVVAMELWGNILSNKKIIFHIDNQAVVTIINKKSSKSPRVMVLVRRLVLLTLKLNMLIKAEHIPGKYNIIADSLSRCDWQRFRKMAPTADYSPTPIPSHLWKI